MNCELSLMKKIFYCKKEIFRLNGDIRQMALESFSSGNVPGGTYAQVISVAEAVLQREKLENFVFEAERIFQNLPKGYGALLAAVYLKRVSPDEISRKYGISVSTVYRKLSKARKLLKRKLEELSEKEFPEVFSFVTADAENDASIE